MYDWANSAFQATVVTVLAGPYLTALAQHAVGENGTVLRLGPLNAATTLPTSIAWRTKYLAFASARVSA